MEEPKSKNQLKNEEKNKLKMEKFLAKQEKMKELVKFVYLKAAKQAEKTKVRQLSDALKPKNFEEFVDTTVPGEKKDLSAPIAAAYDPLAVESAWYAWWEKCGFFKPEYNQSKHPEMPPFVIPIPPPNVTGSLHLGHAMMVAIEDAIIRRKRMQGFHVLYVPGCDHAAISTQVVVEKKLKKELNLLKHEIGREKFLSHVWEWKEKYGDRIYHQIRKMGASVDWDRKKFTMDPDLNEAVNEAFIRMHNEGLIFRDNRLVNWSAKVQTSLSDLEVDHKSIAPRTWLQLPGLSKKYEFGILYSVAYKIDDAVMDQEIIVSTTRPETICGDSGIAVNPKDPRFFSFHGKCVINPLNGRRMPIVLDECAQMEFGTGAVKLTPAHDYNDFAAGKRHNLQFINIFDLNNNLNSNGGKYQGMNRFDARVAIVADLKASGALRDEQPYEITLPFCNRSGDIVEPRMIPQWWLNCESMAAKAVAAVKNKELTILPEENEKVWFHWLENIRDWCISRQLWWGHRVPAYYLSIKGEDPTDQSDEKRWIVAHNLDEAWSKALVKFPQYSQDQIVLTQDEDVLDTWFSSGLWPFSIVGWPKKTADFSRFYPSTLLETGRDIIFFWVARMVMMGLHLTDQLPFKTILLHSIVRDSHGRKMSKSLGNVIDPIDVINGISLADLQLQLEQGNLDPAEVKIAKEGQKKDFPNGIPQCGTDALRFALCAYMSFGRDINLDILRIEGYRKFCNKIWNATKFFLMKAGDSFIPDAKFSLTGNETLVDKWILNRLNEAIKETDKAMEEFQFMAATTAIHRFWLYELCDVYIEASKHYMDSAESTKRVQNILYTCFEQALLLLHPIMPFISEELYQRLPRRPGDCTPSIVVASYPTCQVQFCHTAEEEEFSLIYSLIKSTRSLMDSNNLKKALLSVCISEKKKCLIESQESLILSLTKGLTGLKLEELSSDAIFKESLSDELSISVVSSK